MLCWQQQGAAPGWGPTCSGDASTLREMGAEVRHFSNSGSPQQTFGCELSLQSQRDQTLHHTCVCGQETTHGGGTPLAGHGPCSATQMKFLHLERHSLCIFSLWSAGNGTTTAVPVPGAAGQRCSPASAFCRAGIMAWPH